MANHAHKTAPQRPTQTAKDQATPSNVPLDDGLKSGTDRPITPQIDVDGKNTVDKGDHQRMVADQTRKEAERAAATGRPHHG